MVNINLNVKATGSDLDIGRFGLGQGGFTNNAQFDSHIQDLKNLNHKYLRIFVQNYFDVYPAHNVYNWELLDKMVKTILATGAKSILCICIKPKVLFPKNDDNIIHPYNYKEWDKLIFEMVKHYKKMGVNMWEVLNESDAGEWGGAPYHTKPKDYAIFYEHIARAVKKADPKAKIGGPAVSNASKEGSKITPYLLQYCSEKNLPFDFLTWHRYADNPLRIKESIVTMKNLLKKYPKIKCETGITEWSASFVANYMKYTKNPAYMPNFIIESIFQMVEEGLSFCNYYQIRNLNFTEGIFKEWISKKALSTFGWCNYCFTHLGIFDYQGQPRPAYFAFKLLSRLAGKRIRIYDVDGNVKVLAAYDEDFKMVNALIWNFAVEKPKKETIKLNIYNAEKGEWRYTRFLLDVKTNSSEENRRLRIVERKFIKNTDHFEDTFILEPYGITQINFKKSFPVEV